MKLAVSPKNHASTECTNLFRSSKKNMMIHHLPSITWTDTLLVGSEEARSPQRFIMYVYARGSAERLPNVLFVITTAARGEESDDAREIPLYSKVI